VGKEFSRTVGWSVHQQNESLVADDSGTKADDTLLPQSKGQRKICLQSSWWTTAN